MIGDDLLSAVFAATPAPSAPINDAVEMSVSLGNLITIGSFLVLVTMYIVNSRGAARVLGEKLKSFSDNLDELKDETKKLAEVVVEQARQQGRMELLDQRLLQEGKRLDEFMRNFADFKNLCLTGALHKVD